jgi:hypothetical protein
MELSSRIEDEFACYAAFAEAPQKLPGLGERD